MDNDMMSKGDFILSIAEEFDVTLPMAAGIVSHFEANGWKPPNSISAIEKLNQASEELKQQTRRIYEEVEHKIAEGGRIDTMTPGVRYSPMNDPRMGPPTPPNPTWNKPYG